MTRRPGIYSRKLSQLKPSRKKRPEAIIRDRLAKELRGKTEVLCDVGCKGSIDVLTKRYVIEIKRCSNWMHGVGQLLMYGQEHPNHKLRLHLFDHDEDRIDRNKVKSSCRTYAIKVTFE